jgi:hypothetical protein
MSPYKFLDVALRQAKMGAIKKELMQSRGCGDLKENN